jgi:hypothetical protein
VDNILPNFNVSLVVLQVWNNKREDVGDTLEYPIVAWRILEGDSPSPISTEGEMPEPDDVVAAMVYDRANKIGTFQGGNYHGREQCVKELHDAIARALRAKGAK